MINFIYVILVDLR